MRRAEAVKRRPLRTHIERHPRHAAPRKNGIAITFFLSSPEAVPRQRRRAATAGGKREETLRSSVETAPHSSLPSDAAENRQEKILHLRAASATAPQPDRFLLAQRTSLTRRRRAGLLLQFLGCCGWQLAKARRLRVSVEWIGRISERKDRGENLAMATSVVFERAERWWRGRGLPVLTAWAPAFRLTSLLVRLSLATPLALAVPLWIRARKLVAEEEAVDNAERQRYDSALDAVFMSPSLPLLPFVEAVAERRSLRRSYERVLFPAAAHAAASSAAAAANSDSDDAGRAAAATTIGADTNALTISSPTPSRSSVMPWTLVWGRLFSPPFFLIDRMRT